MSDYVPQTMTKRQVVAYTHEEVDIINLEKTMILSAIQIKKRRGVSMIYDNQKECALKIVSALHNKKIIAAMVIALTQSGKTGTMISLIESYINDHDILIPIDNIYIITGLSSCEWVEQTKHRMPETIQKRVFHRDRLSKEFIDDIKNKKNVLVIIDEIQAAAKEKQTLHNTFDEAGFYDKQILFENDIKIVEFSATPDGNVYDIMKWGENASMIKMIPGEGYTSCFDLLNNGRVFQYKDLCCYDKHTGLVDEDLVSKNIKEIKACVDNYNEPMYHIIRTPNGDKSDIVIENFKKYIDQNIKYHTYTTEGETVDVNSILMKKPEQHTYIFIKEKLRCAKTLYKKFLGVVYERYTKTPNDSVILQGLIGRGTGYDDNGKSIYFTNIPSIKKYQSLWDSNFEDKTVQWKSNTTERRNNTLKSKGTYNNPALIDGMSVSSNESDEEQEPIIKKFTDFAEVKKYVKDCLGNKRGPNDPHKNKNTDGFYECNIRGTKKVCSTNEMFNERRCNIKNGAGYGFRYCYGDINDKSTLEFWVIHYPRK